MMNNQDMDNTSRDKIRNVIDRNFFVEAGAGSGKTTVLVDRMVSMVEGGLDISKICAITFTKAAASEFYARFQKKLSESSSQKAKEALKNIDLCFMGTIDSFCNMVLSEHPAKAKIPSNSTVVSDEEKAELYRRELSKIQCGEYDDTLKKKYELFRSYYYNADEIFIKGLPRLMDTRNAQLNIPAAPCSSIDDIYRDEIDRLRDNLVYLSEHTEILQLGSASARDAAEELEDPNSLRYLKGSWADELENVIRVLNKLKGLRIDKNIDPKDLAPGMDMIFQPRISKDKLSWFEIPPEKDPLLIERLNDIRYAAAMDFLSSCVSPISEKLRGEGKLSYSDYLLYLRDMLKEDAGAGGRLIKHIFGRHSYYLIDEFQDTDPVQAEIFFYLCAEKPEPDWTKCVPKPGSLFIVGDPKQSIYRFRNADVASFQKVKALFTGNVGEVLILSRNFRSTELLCSFFNDVFTSLLPDDTENQSRFEAIPLGNKPDYKASLNGAYRYTIQSTRSFKDSEDPQTVATIIRSILEDPDITIQGRGEKAVPRRPEYKDFMIITPAKTHMQYYMNALTAEGIPFRIEGKLLFDRCPALKLVSAIMSAASDPNDGKSRFRLNSISGCHIPEDRFSSYRSMAYNMSPAAFFSLVMDQERVFAKAGSENAEYVYYALELLRQAEIEGSVSTVRDGAAFINGLITEGSDQERCIQLVKDTNRVHIANLHKVKGLEAPIVILADPKRSTSIPELRVDYSGEMPQSWVFSISDPQSHVALMNSSKYPDEMKKESQALAAEADRLLYVAATRAENALIVSIARNAKGINSDSNPWLPLESHIGNDIFAQISRKPPELVEAELVDADALYEAAEADSPLNNEKIFEKSYEILRPSTVKIKTASEAENEAEDEAISNTGEAAESKPEAPAEDHAKADAKAAENAAIVRDYYPPLMGTMVHRIMEVMVSSKNATDPASLLNEVLRDYGAPDIPYRAHLEFVIKTIQNGGYKQESATPQDILKELLSAEKVYCELPFCYSKDQSQIWHGVMDVVYLKDGKWHILDYKTNADPSDLEQRYQDQLAAYIEAFRAMTGEDAVAEIYHIEV